MSESVSTVTAPAVVHGAPPATPPQTGGTDRPRSAPRLARYRDLALVPALVVILVVGGLINGTFLTGNNLLNVLGAASALALLVLAETLILLTGKFDLSLESTAGLAPALGIMLVIPAAAAGFGTELPVWVGIVVILLVGAVVGVINGFLTVKLGLNAFVVTLAMLTILRGVQVGTTEGKTLFDAPEAFFTIGSGTFVGVPISAWIAGAAFLIAGLVLRYHRAGRALYAIGGNADAARAAGIRVDRIAFVVFVIGGMLAALAGLVLAGRIGAIDANLGDGMIFTVFAAAVIGGVSLDGGRGTIFGALCGVLLLSMVDNLLTLAHVEPFWIKAIYGGIILFALILSRITSGRSQA
jgi:simple sugar transport system permease protein